MLYDKEALCNKIREIFPDIGVCGIDIDVAYDANNRAYVVDLKKGNEELKTFLEEDEAALCMEGRQCVALGLQVAQLRTNIESKNDEMPHRASH